MSTLYRPTAKWRRYYEISALLWIAGYLLADRVLLGGISVSGRL